ncbi:MAG: CPBP family intramembrane glutamic endopeptidase [Chitinophagales bacterium]
MNPLVVYFGLAYLISWTIWLPLYGSTIGLSHLPTLPYHHASGGLGPLLASFCTTWIYHKKEGVYQLLRKCIQIKPLLYLIIALCSPFILALIAAIINYGIAKTPINLSGLLHSKEFPQFHIHTFFIYNLIFFGFGEEVGWRGFALPRLQKKWNALTASVFLTVFWAIWHLPLFFYRPGYTSMDMAGMLGWVFSLLTGSVLLTWLYNSSLESILICAIFHSTIDIAFTADLADKNMVNYMGLLITVWGIMILIIFKPQNLSNKTRETAI